MLKSTLCILGVLMILGGWISVARAEDDTRSAGTRRRSAILAMLRQVGIAGGVSNADANQQPSGRTARSSARTPRPRSGVILASSSVQAPDSDDDNSEKRRNSDDFDERHKKPKPKKSPFKHED